MRKKLVRKRWSKEEERTLVGLVERGYSWEQIAHSSMLPIRNEKACRVRYNLVMRRRKAKPYRVARLVKQISFMCSNCGAKVEGVKGGDSE